jgi:hypothetical protein
MTTSDPQKRASIKWRANNRERHNAYSLIKTKLYNLEHKDEISDKRKINYAYKKSFDFENERKVFFKILI